MLRPRQSKLRDGHNWSRRCSVRRLVLKREKKRRKRKARAEEKRRQRQKRKRSLNIHRQEEVKAWRAEGRRKHGSGGWLRVGGVECEDVRRSIQSG